MYYAIHCISMYNSNVLSEAYPQQSSGLLIYVTGILCVVMS